MSCGPTVDVVIPTRDGESHIQRAVDGVLAQTHVDLHLIIVDDGSTDGTAEVLRRFDDPRMTVLRQPATGVSAARNRGASAGTGEYLVFLDGDDEVDEHWLSSLVDVDRDAVLVGCAGRICRPDGHSWLTSIKRPSSTGTPPQPVFLAGLFMVRRDLFDHVGGYDETLARSENTDLGFRLTDAARSRGLPVATTDDALVTIYRAVHQAAKYSPTTRQHAAETMLRKHSARFARDPKAASEYHAVAGVAALRNSDKSSARPHLRRAVRLRPSNWRYWARLIQAELPPR